MFKVFERTDRATAVSVHGQGKAAKEFIFLNARKEEEEAKKPKTKRIKNGDESGVDAMITIF
jgi:hypothetical protein